MHPWHGVFIGKNAPERVTCVIEVPKGSKNKFELDKITGMLRVDRVLYSSVHYPANYGFIPQTYCPDNDPLDILVLGQEAVVPLCLMEAIPIGYMRMIDQGETDDKIIAVHANDPEYNQFKSIKQLPEHRLKEVKRFFLDYKTLEHKEVVVEDFFDVNEALVVIRESMEHYTRAIGHK